MIRYVENYDYENKRYSIEDIEIVGNSPEIMHVFELINSLERQNLNILVTGETGTGKENVVKALHKISGGNGHFVKINSPALTEELFEAELFGYKKGAFTGALKDKIGLLEKGNGGTISFNEICEMPLGQQAKILAIFDEKEFYPVGGTEAKKIDFFRVISATNGDLEKLIESNLFRKDLYYRLAQFHIHLPPLRNRLEDIPLLAEHFLKKYRPQNSSPIKISNSVIKYLREKDWSGNIRQLENTIRKGLVFHDGNENLTIDHLAGRYTYSKTQENWCDNHLIITANKLATLIGGENRYKVEEAIEDKKLYALDFGTKVIVSKYAPIREICDDDMIEHLIDTFKEHSITLDRKNKLYTFKQLLDHPYTFNSGEKLNFIIKNNDISTFPLGKSRVICVYLDKVDLFVPDSKKRYHSEFLSEIDKAHNNFMSGLPYEPTPVRKR